MSGVIFGFLRYNTFPASVFMGDTGSQFLGFTAGTLSIALTQGNTALSPVLPLILLGFPVLDTLTVMGARMAQGRSPFVADKSHFHHNLMKLGLYHPESVLVIYILQTILILAAYLLRYQSEWLLLGGYLLFSAAILAAFALADRGKKSFKRSGIWDTRIKGRLRKLRENGSVNRVTFRVFQAGIPLLFLVSCVIPTQVPGSFSWLPLAAAGAVGGTWLLRRNDLETVLRFALYLAVPFVVYLGETNHADWLDEPLGHAYTAAFGFFAVCILIISMFSRRTEGFKSTPLDFLIFLLVLMLVKVPGEQVEDYHFGVIAAKVIIFYFSYEVLIAELRGKIGRIALVTMATLILFSLKSLFL